MPEATVNSSRQRRSDLYGLAAVFCWSTVATAFKLSLAHLTPPQLLLVSSIVCWLFLGSILAWRGTLGMALFTLRGYSRLSLLMGAINPCLYYLVLFGAYAMLPAQEAQAINYSWALTLSLLAVPLLGHALRRRELLTALISYAGVVVIATRGQVTRLEFASPLGVTLAVLSTVLWSLYWILNTRDTRDPVTALFLNFTMALPILTLYCWLTGELTDIPRRGLPGAAYVGLFEMGVSFVLWSKAMKLTASAARTATLIFISPVLSLALIATVLREPIRVSTLVGLGLILTGVALQRVRPRR
ncbi:MAG: DMT family transporter [Lentisphaeria bacterium]|nr:DMT family transporter [Lentisphaeria bacterium]